jgi:glycosyltransferase involved in cell wall biosynthesis
MRIAQLSPLTLSVPATGYGAVERILDALCTRLVDNGHEVTLFATAGCASAARVVPVAPVPSWSSTQPHSELYQLVQLAEVAAAAGSFDVIHAHAAYWPLLLHRRVPAAIVTTVYGRLHLPPVQQVLARFPDAPIVALSRAHRAQAAPLDAQLRVVPPGLPLRERYPLGDGRGGYLAFLGRLSPHKGVAQAIEIAARAGLPLKIAGIVRPEDAEFFVREIRPRLCDGGVAWIGEVTDADKAELLGRAQATLMPLQWDEPFGLVFIESLACGTPVVACPRGAVREIVVDGVTGYLSGDPAELAAACRAVEGLDRAACRRSVLDRFSDATMAAAYEALYREVAELAAGHARGPVLF